MQHFKRFESINEAFASKIIKKYPRISEVLLRIGVTPSTVTDDSFMEYNVRQAKIDAKTPDSLIDQGLIFGMKGGQIIFLWASAAKADSETLQRISSRWDKPVVLKVGGVKGFISTMSGGKIGGGYTKVFGTADEMFLYVTQENDQKRWTIQNDRRKEKRLSPTASFEERAEAFKDELKKDQVKFVFDGVKDIAYQFAAKYPNSRTGVLHSAFKSIFEKDWGNYSEMGKEFNKIVQELEDKRTQ